MFETTCAIVPWVLAKCSGPRAREGLALRCCDVLAMEDRHGSRRCRRPLSILALLLLNAPYASARRGAARVDAILA
jgi:hypothetical protein